MQCEMTITILRLHRVAGLVSSIFVSFFYLFFSLLSRVFLSTSRRTFLHHFVCFRQVPLREIKFEEEIIEIIIIIINLHFHLFGAFNFTFYFIFINSEFRISCVSGNSMRFVLRFIFREKHFAPRSALHLNWIPP
jgi:hypothetical protein